MMTTWTERRKYDDDDEVGDVMIRCSPCRPLPIMVTSRDSSLISHYRFLAVIFSNNN